MEAPNHQIFQHPRSCFTAIPTGLHPMKKQQDFFTQFWAQWTQCFEREVVQQQLNECKVEENPAYTYHGSECAPPEAKQDGHKDDQPAEGIEAILQRRAISLSHKQPLSQSERDQLLKYRTYRLGNYLIKKNQRNFEKKIVYASRKKVADRRIRFQGKFINEFQAMEMLGLHGQQRTFDELKEMMKALNKA